MTSRLLRPAAAAALALTLMGVLTACEAAAPTCTSETTEGATSALVTSSTELGTDPAASFPVPVLPKKTEVSRLIQGSGAPLTGGQLIVSALTVYNGADGEVIEQAGYDASSSASFVIDQVPIEGIKKGLECATKGSRVAMTIPASEGYPATSLPAGLTEEDSIVVVLDILDAYPARATGAPQVMQSGLPAVVLNEDGVPGITVPSTDPPSELTIADLRTGSGETVKAGDSVVLHYTGVLWDTGDVFDSSWENGAPITLTADPESLIPGFAEALTGEKVGSQVLAVIPPDQGYGDQAQGSIPADSTLVFVIDILGISANAAAAPTE